MLLYSRMTKKILFSVLLTTSIMGNALSADPVELLDTLDPYQNAPGIVESDAIAQVYVDQLNVTYPNGLNPFDALVQGQILYPSGRALGALGIMSTPNLLPVPPNCDDQTFGLSGQFTELVCSTVEKFKDLCNNLEPTCDPSKIPPIIAGKAEILKNTPVAATVVCFQSDPNIGNCLDATYVTTYYAPLVEELQGLIASPYVPGNYENPLLTNNEFTSDEALVPNSHHVIGDSYYELRQMTSVLDSDDKKDLDVMLDVLIALFDHTYVQSHKGDFTRQNYFRTEFLVGYFGKKYNYHLFPTSSLRAEVVPVSVNMRFTGCAMALGVLAGTYCGFDPDEAASFYQFYLETLPVDDIDTSSDTTVDLFCSPFTEAHLEMATKVMKENSKWKPPSTETLTIEQCMQALKFPTDSCSDSPLRLKIPTSSGGVISRYCSWVGTKDVKNRCALPGVSAACPLTCESCDSCEDPSDDLRFKFYYNGKEIIRNCDFIGRVEGKVYGRCMASENTCRKTCGTC